MEKNMIYLLGTLAERMRYMKDTKKNDIKLIIFDLDGTLADTIEGITEGINSAMSEAGYPTHTRESVLGFINYGTRRYIEEGLPPHVRSDTEEVTRVMNLYIHHYAQTYTMTSLYEGMTELMFRLKDDYLLAINSNKQDEFVKVLAKQLFPDGLFIAAEGFCDGRPAKPDPGMAYAIMDIASEKLGQPITPDECVYVGDSDVDVLTARNAGMHGVSVSWGYRSYDFLKALGDQPVCATIDELYEVLTTMATNHDSL